MIMRAQEEIPEDQLMDVGILVFESKEMTEEEWLAKERKEIEEVEKTVTIRFANYTTMMRANQLTQGLSSQLQMFLTNIGPSGNAVLPKTEGAAVDDKTTEFTKKLLEKAGLKVDGTDSKVDDDTADTGKQTRSISPEIADQPSLTEKTIVAKASSGAASEWEV